MTKKDFIDMVANKSGLSKKDAQKAIDCTLETISETLVAGDNVSFIGFGAFTVVTRAERQVRAPGTDRVISLPATKVVKFKVGKKLKEDVSTK